MGNLGSFKAGHVSLKPLVCPFQDGMNLSPKCDGVRCGYGLWCGVHKRCVLRCIGVSCREGGNGVLNSGSAEKVGT